MKTGAYWKKTTSKISFIEKKNDGNENKRKKKNIYAENRELALYTMTTAALQGSAFEPYSQWKPLYIFFDRSAIVAFHYITFTSNNNIHL